MLRSREPGGKHKFEGCRGYKTVDYYYGKNYKMIFRPAL